MRTIKLTVDEALEKIIEKIKLESGFATDQEFLKKVIEEYHVRLNQAIDESSNSTLGENSWQYAELQIKEIIGEKSRKARSSNPSKHPLLTIDLVDMMHNKIFPVILVLKTLQEITKDKPGEWVELNSFKKNVIEKAKQVARENPELSTGLPQTDESLKKKYHRINRRIEQSRKSDSSFTDRFVGYVNPRISNFSNDGDEENVYDFLGAPAEWGLLEARIDMDGDWIRLTEKAKKFLNLPSVESKDNPLSGDDDKNVVLWLMENIFSGIKLEFKVMMNLLSKEQYGDQNRSGLDVMEDEFYTIQKEHLKNLAQKGKNESLSPQIHEFSKILEKMVDWEKNKKGRNRVGATMGRLMEMNLFQKKGKTVYVRTFLGKTIFEKLK